MSSATTTDNEVETRKVLLFSDFTFLIISSLHNPHLLALVKDVVAIRVCYRGGLLAKGAAAQWEKLESEDLQRFLQDDKKLALEDLPQDVKEVYLLSSVVTVEIEQEL